MNCEELRKKIQIYLRQHDGGYYPLKLRLDPTSEESVDEVAAQRIYEEEIASIEKRVGPLPRWDNDTNAPVPGTPIP